VALAVEITAWMQMLALTDHPECRWEPKRLRLRPGRARSSAERKELPWLLDPTADATELVVSQGVEKAQLQYRTKG